MEHAYPEIQRGGSLLLAWQLKGRTVLLVGGGPVAAGRLVNIIEGDANVILVCPRSGLCPEMVHRLEVEKCIMTYHDRQFLDSDLGPNPCAKEGSEHYQANKVDMVLTAIDNIEESRRICLLSRSKRIPVNVADVPPECDFYFGSQIRRGPLQVMVSTGGKGPRLANQIRRHLEQALPSGGVIEGAISATGRLRSKLRVMAPSPEDGPDRMAWMIKVCDAFSWQELSDMNDDDIERILSGWQDKTVPRGAVAKGYLTGLHPRRLLGAAPSWLGPLIIGFYLGTFATKLTFPR